MKLTFKIKQGEVRLGDIDLQFNKVEVGDMITINDITIEVIKKEINELD